MCAPQRDCAVRHRAIAFAIILAAIPWALLIPGDVLRAEEPASLPPAWACLPEHTTLVVRCPNLAAFADALTKQTRLGAALNDAERWKNALGYLARQCGTDLEEVERKLATYELKLDDWRALASAEMGYAGIADEEFAAIAEGKAEWSDPDLHEAFVAWLEPTDELGRRLWKAWDRWTSQAVADHAYLKRVDEALADVPVIRLSAKDPPIPHGTLNTAGGFSGRGLFFNVSNDLEVKKKKDSDEPDRPYGEYHLLVARVGRRFLLVHNTPGRVEDEEQTEAASAKSLERCRQVMAQLIERHRQRSEPSPWLREAMAQTPRDGTPLFELHGNLPLMFTAIINWMDQELRDSKEELAAFPAEPELWNVFKPTLAGLGTVAIRGSLQENRWERTIRVGLAHERGGLLSVFDAGSLPAEPAAWVPATAQSYSQINLDVTPIVEQLRSVLQAARQDPDYSGALTLVENQLHVDLAELICGLGPRMIFVEFADPPEGKQRVGLSEAVLWQVRNDEQWQKGLEAAASSFGQKLLKRDGYVGLQISLTDDSSKAKQSKKWLPWLLAGHGHLLYVAGDDPTGPPLAQLPQPAAGGDGFRDSRAFRRYTELFPGDTCFAFQCIDRSATAETAYRLNEWISELAKLRLIPYDAASKDKSKETLRSWSREWWTRLLGDESTQRLLSFEADRMTIEPEGVLHRSVLEFVPPER